MAAELYGKFAKRILAVVSPNCWMLSNTTFLLG
ncbi:MAG: hypothetical protein RL766_1808, partial [Bacteroidota bacterium]